MLLCEYPPYRASVTARDVIEQIKALPPQEQEKVREFVTAQLPLKVMEKDTFEPGTKQVFERRRELMHRLSQ
jgi:hypothetical protein